MSVGNVYKQGKCSKIKIQKHEQLKWINESWQLYDKSNHEWTHLTSKTKFIDKQLYTNWH